MTNQSKDNIMLETKLETKIEVLTTEMKNFNKGIDKFEAYVKEEFKDIKEKLKTNYTTNERHDRLRDEVKRQGKILYGIITTVAIALLAYVIKYIESLQGR